MAEFLCNPKTGGIPDTNGVSKSEEPIQGHTVVEPLNCRLYSEILKEFTDWYFSVSPENFDEGLLDAYLEEMEGLSPLESSFDSQASLEKFHERFSSFFETQEESSNSEHPKRQASRLLIKINKLGIVAASCEIAASSSVPEGPEELSFGLFALLLLPFLPRQGLALHRRADVAATETIRICLERGVLTMCAVKPPPSGVGI